MSHEVAIDPIEVALAVVGVRPIISRKVERIGAEAVRDMEAFGRRLEEGAKACARGDKMRVPLGDVNYDTMLRDLTDEYSEAQVLAMIEKFPPALKELAPEFIIKAREVVEYMLSLFPRQVRQTLAGPKNIPPPEMAVRAFVATLTVLDDPLRVFSLIGTGSLLVQQRDAMRAIYPTISTAIDEELDDAVSDEAGKLKSYEVPPLTEIGAATWAGRPTVSPALGAALQAAHAQAKQQAANVRKDPESADIVAKEAMSNAQRNMYGPQATE